MSGSRLRTWLHRIGYVTTVIVLAALAYVGYAKYRDRKGPSVQAPRASATAPDRRSPDGLWTLTTKSSSNPEPRTAKICVNGLVPAELSTCAGVGDAPTTDRPTTRKVSCTDGDSSESISVVMSADARVLRYRSDRLDSYGEKQEKYWADTTMTYEGDCPVGMKDEQLFFVVKPDGKAADPFPATACMVAVLKTVPGVTKPETGYVWDRDGGPYPFVRFTYPSTRSHMPTVITFRGNETVGGDPNAAVFGTEIGGGYDPQRETAPKNVAQLWKARCGVAAGIAYD